MNIIDPTPIEYISTFPELLAKSAPPDPRYTKVEGFRLPNTVQLDERYCIVVAGPEAAYVFTALVERMAEFAKTLDLARSREPA
jgi:hypothetical protein